MNDTNKYYSMDETDSPYEEGQAPYQRTVEDDLFLIKFAESNNLELKTDGPLYMLKTRQIDL